MKTLTATAVKNRIADAWEIVKTEPVAVVSHGEPIAIILSPAEYERLRLSARPLRRGGYMQGLFAGVDWDETLARPAAGFEDYT